MAVVTNPLGTHVVLDLYDCEAPILDSEKKVEEVLKKAAEVANATVIGSVFRKFSPQGVSGVVVVSESHLAIHTWPEHRYASVDIYTCGDHTMPAKAGEYIIKEFKCGRPTIVKMDRGVMFRDD